MKKGLMMPKKESLNRTVPRTSTEERQVVNIIEAIEKHGARAAAAVSAVFSGTAVASAPPTGAIPFAWSEAEENASREASIATDIIVASACRHGLGWLTHDNVMKAFESAEFINLSRREWIRSKTTPPVNVETPSVNEEAPEGVEPDAAA